jgi:predicted permease
MTRVPAALRVYRRLLRVLPDRFRRRHEAELVSLTSEMLADARVRGRLAYGAAVVAAVWDVVKRAAVERRREGTTQERRTRDWMLGADLRFAMRSLRRHPYVSVLVVGMLALGIAVNTAVFSVVNGLFLKPLPFPEAGQLVYINETAPRWNLEYTGINYPDFHTWRENVEAFRAIAIFEVREYSVSDGSDAVRLRGLEVTHDFDEVLGIAPVLGRTFLPAEDAPGGERVVMLGHGLWRTRFGADRQVLGRTLHVDGYPHTIVGVLPRSAAFPGGVELWLPLRGDPAQPYQSYSGNAVGRLLPGATVAAAQSDLERVHTPIWEARDSDRVVSPIVLPLRDYFVGDYRSVSAALFGAVAIVLLIACSNVACLMLARALSRRREMGIRVAMGARTGRLVRQLFVENLLLAVLGGVLGIALGQVALRMLLARLPEQFPLWATFALDPRVVLFSLLVTVATAVLFGSAPAWIGARSDVRGALHATGGRNTASAGARRTLRTLIAAEVALAVAPLVVGGLLLRAYDRVLEVDPGFATENVLTFTVALPEGTYPDSLTQRPFWQALLERIEALPGVASAGAISCLPLGCHWGNFLEVEGAPPPAEGQADPVILFRVASPGYFDAMSIGRVGGRFYDASDDRSGGERVLVVNETFARQFWPDVHDPVGRRVRGRGDDDPWWTVIGVSRDVKHYGLDDPMRPGIYVPPNLMPSQLRSLSIAVRAEGDALALVPSARRVVRDLDRTVPLAAIGTMEAALQRSLALRRTYSWALALFAGLALLLAVGGIYGVTSYLVTQRTREIGIRMALGARTGVVVRSIARGGMLPVLAGVIVGLVSALAAARAISGLLFGVQPTEVAVYAGVASLLLLAALAAQVLPARRAARIDPIASLRGE